MAAGSGTGTGGGSGAGAGTGKGSGQGPGSGSGTGGGDGTGGFPPVNKQMILPPTEGVPKELRGREIQVTFSVAPDGRVTSFVVAPPIENRAFAKKFDEIMRGYSFTPARDAHGKNIADTVGFTIVLGSK